MSRTASRRGRDEGGSATVLGIGLLALLITGALVGATVAGMLVGQRRAASGADMAALAGASALQQGRSGCGRAVELATANNVRLVGCAARGDVVTVKVITEVTSALGSRWIVRARARAGPVG